MKNFASLIPPPCTDCYITHAQADLQYPNGTYANANTGMWLHHVVVSNLNRTGAVCPMYADYVFASGNERTPANICVNGYAFLYLPPFFLFSQKLNSTQLTLHTIPEPKRRATSSPPAPYFT